MTKLGTATTNPGTEEGRQLINYLTEEFSVEVGMVHGDGEMVVIIREEEE